MDAERFVPNPKVARQRIIFVSAVQLVVLWVGTPLLMRAYPKLSLSFFVLTAAGVTLFVIALAAYAWRNAGRAHKALHVRPDDFEIEATPPRRVLWADVSASWFDGTAMALGVQTADKTKFLIPLAGFTPEERERILGRFRSSVGSRFVHKLQQPI